MPPTDNESEPMNVVLARIETKLDRAISDGSDHEQRIRSLEAWKYGIPCSAFCAVAGIVVAALRGHGL